MPTILEENGYRFKFFSNENNEPPHIHVTKGDGNAKYWLVPDCVEEYAYGFTIRERRDIKIIVNENAKLFIKKWNEYFK
jgi:hypothetical protein